MHLARLLCAFVPAVLVASAVDSHFKSKIPEACNARHHATVVVSRETWMRPFNGFKRLCSIPEVTLSFNFSDLQTKPLEKYFQHAAEEGLTLAYNLKSGYQRLPSPNNLLRSALQAKERLMECCNYNLVYLMFLYHTHGTEEHIYVLQEAGFKPFSYNASTMERQLANAIYIQALEPKGGLILFDADNDPPAILSPTLYDSLSRHKYTLVSLDKCLGYDPAKGGLLEEILGGPIGQIPRCLDSHIKNGVVENPGSALADDSCLKQPHIVKLLLKDPSITQGQLGHAFAEACRQWDRGMEDSATELLGDQRLAAVDSRSNALAIASRYGRIKVVEFLIDEGIANPTANESECLRLASANGHTNVVQLLLLKTKTNPADKASDALCQAIDGAFYDVVDALLTDGRADPQACFSAFITVFRKRKPDLIERLLRDGRLDPSGNDNSALDLAFKDNYIGVQELLLKDPRVNVPKRLERSILHSAIYSQRPEWICLLVERKKIDLSIDNYVILRYAAKDNVADLVDLFIGKALELESVALCDALLRTASRMLARSTYKRILELLVDREHEELGSTVFVSVASNKETLLWSLEVAVEMEKAKLYEICFDLGARPHMLDALLKQARVEFLDAATGECSICLGGLDLEILNKDSMRLAHEDCMWDLILSTESASGKKTDLILHLLNVAKIDPTAKDNAILQYSIASGDNGLYRDLVDRALQLASVELAGSILRLSANLLKQDDFVRLVAFLALENHDELSKVVSASVSSNPQALLWTYTLAIEVRHKGLHGIAIRLGAQPYMLEASFKESNMEFLEKESIECPICLEFVNLGIVVDTSNHVIHEKCLESLLASSWNCPICRRSIVPSKEFLIDLFTSLHRTPTAVHFGQSAHFLMKLMPLESRVGWLLTSFKDPFRFMLADLIDSLTDLADPDNVVFRGTVWGCLINPSTSEMKDEICLVQKAMELIPVKDSSFGFALAAAKLLGNNAMAQFIGNQLSEEQIMSLSSEAELQRSRGEVFSRALATDYQWIYKQFLSNGLDWKEELPICVDSKSGTYQRMTLLDGVYGSANPNGLKVVLETCPGCSFDMETLLKIAIRSNDAELIRAIPKTMPTWLRARLSPLMYARDEGSFETLVALLERGIVFDLEITEPIYCPAGPAKIFKARGIPCKVYSEVPGPLLLGQQLTVQVRTLSNAQVSITAGKSSTKTDIRISLFKMGIEIPPNCWLEYFPNGSDDMAGPAAMIRLRPGRH